jgi:hypothetical protein
VGVLSAAPLAVLPDGPSVRALRWEILSSGNSEGFPGGADLRNSSSFTLPEQPDKSARPMPPASKNDFVKCDLVVNMYSPEFKRLENPP